MRKIVIRADAAGTSIVDSIEDLPPAIHTDVAFFASDRDALPETAGTSELWDLGLAPGESKFIMVEFPPDFETPYHRTNSVDFDVIIDGEVTLVLGNGEVDLRTGDCVVIHGADHAWRTGPTRCLVSSVPQAC